MLVLRRKVDEVVVIDGCIEVMVVAIRGNKVRIGITAPGHIPITRDDTTASGGGSGGGMLVLSRKRQEKIFLGTNIVITLVSIGKGSAKLGFEAPGGIEIIRQEARRIDTNPSPTSV